MKNTIFFIAACAVFTAASAQTNVKPHITKDGTFVQGHVRSAPNNTNLDNYSTKGNVNPYTGQSGTVQPNYAPASPSQQQCGLNAKGVFVCK